MGKYYCDYCDKEFQDTQIARKRHLQSSSHLRAKSIWFNSLHPNHPYTDTAAAAGFTKGLCNRFVKTGFCPFGDSCKYFHPNNTTNNFQSTGLMDNAQSQSQSPFFPGNQLVGRSSLQGDVVKDSTGMSWGNLPPSLKPTPEGGYLPLPFLDWG